MENKNYDVVIVGSGIAGAIITKTLIDAGKTVLLLEAGLDDGIAFSREESYKTHQHYLQTYYKASAKTPNSPYPNIKSAPSIDVLEIPIGENNKTKGYLVQKGPLPFSSDSLRGPGGTTLHWLGTTLRMLPNDFKLKTKYGKGVDWPISYNDLKPYYEMAEFEIGVSGNVSEQILPKMGRELFGKDYEFPMNKVPQSYMDELLKRKTENLKVLLNGNSYNLTCISTPQGRNSIPNKHYKISGVKWDASKHTLKLVYCKGDENYEPIGAIWDPYTGQRCEGNASCVPICPVQAKYNALKTLKKAHESGNGNLKILTQAVASNLIIDKKLKNSPIKGIRYKKYNKNDSLNYTTHIATGSIYVLSANAIENAKILLASNAANSSDQVGRNLMDHLCLLTWGLFPEKVFPFRGPGSTTNIPTFRDGSFREEHAPWIIPLDNWGWGWPEFSPGSDVNNAVNNGLFGKELREKINNIISRQILLHFECEQEPDPDNRVSIDPKYTDYIDNYRPVIHYNVSEYVLKAFEASKKVSDQIFEANGIEDLTSYDKQDAGYMEFKGKPYAYRGAGHIVGTHRMGTSKENSVVNENGLTWDHENLFLAGCGNMPTLGTSNPTLTLAALSFKAAEAILKQLEK